MAARPAKPARAKSVVPKPAVTDAAPAVPNRAGVWIERHARWIAAVAILFASLRIVATYHVFAHTFDEPTHIATGMEWLDRKSYTWEPQHPPLARVAAAIGPYLLGHHTHKLPNPASKAPEDNKEHEGLAILYEKHEYDRTLAAARAGILPFFWIACVVVWEWGRRWYGLRTAAIATVVFTFLPPVLAHAGLATTDMAVTAFTGAAFVTGMMWLERPSIGRSVLFGMAVACAVTSKFSSLAFLPAAAVLAGGAWLAVERRSTGVAERLRAALPQLGIAVLTACLAIWAAYRFSFHHIPAPELFQGIGDVLRHNQEGHLSYLFGELSTTGWWYFFPVVLFFKTPVAVLLLCALWVAIPGLRARWKSIVVPVAYSAAILLVGMSANINLGVRHVLPIYIGLALIAGAAADALLNEAWSPRWAAPLLGVLAVWLCAASLLAHPDYLPYFNEFAGGNPEKIVVDSDLEWGQDLKRLATRLHELGAPSVTISTEEIADFSQHDFPPYTMALDGLRPSPGWTAIDVTRWKKRMGFGLAGQKIVFWFDRIPPVEKVGAGYYLWYVPPAAPR